eukprot:1689174-Karenia_brevis.AAC.1
MESILISEGNARIEDELIRQEPEAQDAFMWRSIGVHLRLSGVRLGLDGLMPRTPAVYQHKVKWRTYDEVWDEESIS